MSRNPSSEEILLDFVEIRLDLYKKRKVHLIETLTQEVERISNKAKFIQMVVDDELVIFKKKKAVLEKELEKLFPKIDESFDYLLNIKTYQYTEDAIEEMKKEVGTKTVELEKLKKTTILSMWQSDILKI